jgi:hypothetical protein
MVVVIDTVRGVGGCFHKVKRILPLSYLKFRY